MTTNEPVNGLEETLQVEIIYGASKKELPMRAQFGQDGAYTADVLPTEAGDYTWHIWGDIEGTPVDVDPKSASAFPAAGATLTELQEQSQPALTVGILGAVLGAIGIVVGYLGMHTKRS